MKTASNRMLLCSCCKNRTGEYAPTMLYTDDEGADKVICSRCMSHMNQSKFEGLEDDAREVIAAATYNDLVKAYKSLAPMAIMEDVDTDDPEADKMWAYDNTPSYMKGYF